MNRRLGLIVLSFSLAACASVSAAPLVSSLPEGTAPPVPTATPLSAALGRLQLIEFYAVT